MQSGALWKLISAADRSLQKPPCGRPESPFGTKTSPQGGWEPGGAPHSKTGLFQRVISPLGGVYRIRGVDVNNSMRQLPRITILSQLFSLDFPPILIILELEWPLRHIDLAVRYRLPG